MIPKKRGRGRPRSFDIDAALDCAVEVFWKNGYEGADLSALTEAMGINRPSLYVAYGDKRALFFKAVERYYQTVARVPLPVATDGKCPDLSFFTEAILDLFYRHKRSRGCLIACVLADQANAHEDARAILKELIAREDTAPRELGVHLPFRGTRCHESPMSRQSADSDAPHGCY